MKAYIDEFNDHLNECEITFLDLVDHPNSSLQELLETGSAELTIGGKTFLLVLDVREV